MFEGLKNANKEFNNSIKKAVLLRKIPLTTFLGSIDKYADAIASVKINKENMNDFKGKPSIVSKEIKSIKQSIVDKIGSNDITTKFKECKQHIIDLKSKLKGIGETTVSGLKDVISSLTTLENKL